MNPVDHPHGGGNHQHIGMGSLFDFECQVSNILYRQGIYNLKICCTRSKGRLDCCSENWSITRYTEGQGLRCGLNGFPGIRMCWLCMNVLSDGAQLRRKEDFKNLRLICDPSYGTIYLGWSSIDDANIKAMGWGAAVLPQPVIRYSMLHSYLNAKLVHEDGRRYMSTDIFVFARHREELVDAQLRGTGMICAFTVYESFSGILDGFGAIAI
jgi:hypothetical protein